MAKYYFTFHDYGGNDEKYARIDGNHFIYKYSYSEYCDDTEKDELSPFDALRRVKQSLNSVTNAQTLVVSDISESRISDTTYPYRLTENKRVITSNYVGVLKYKADDLEVTIQIGSRFDIGNSSQLFLSYMMSNAFDGEWLPEHTPEIKAQSIWELLLCFIFYKQVKDAYRQGLFKSYKKSELNDPKVRGVVDINRHIKLNVPFTGNIAYTVREHSHDVPIMHLIRHTFDHLKKRYPELMERLNNYAGQGIRLKNIMEQLKEVTASFNPSNILGVLDETKKRLAHPYFHKYEPLRKTCRMILKDMGLNIYDSNQDDQVYGVLVDINRLWEEFAGKCVLERLGFEHIVNKTTPLLVPYEDINKRGKNAVKSREYDFVKGSTMIVDAKHKPAWQKPEWGELSSDINQVLAYMLVSGVKKVGVVFPISTKTARSKGIAKYHIWTDHSKNSHGTDSDPYSQDYYFYTIPVNIPDTMSVNEFKTELGAGISKLVEELRMEGV